jgi:hypothetical protein
MQYTGSLPIHTLLSSEQEGTSILQPELSQNQKSSMNLQTEQYSNSEILVFQYMWVGPPGTKE